MVSFPNAKINIGLNIVSKRQDGFHNIETIFYPIGLCDALEIIETENLGTTMSTHGLGLDIDGMQNICIKAYQLLKTEFKLPHVEMHLFKKIPSGAGLGGGSSDAAFALKQLNDLFGLGLSSDRLIEYSLKLGSDCAFFIENKAVFAHGRGEIFKPINLNLGQYFLYLVKPDVFVSTADAYNSVCPTKPQTSLIELINEPVVNWNDLIINDFEKIIFNVHPILDEIKLELYNAGTIYASMSGSGSSIYGIFKEQPKIIEKFKDYFSWIHSLSV
jgi:4-diphosphocytidyl-2-C-methyl-D-erythritol kinase